MIDRFFFDYRYREWSSIRLAHTLTWQQRWYYKLSCFQKYQHIFDLILNWAKRSKSKNKPKLLEITTTFLSFYSSIYSFYALQFLFLKIRNCFEIMLVYFLSDFSSSSFLITASNSSTSLYICICFTKYFSVSIYRYANT